MDPTFFKTPEEFRKWFLQNFQKEKELLVGFYKVQSDKQSITWSQSVDVALCFGWIDGIRKSVNHESYTIRFTPRKANSIWSAINIRKVEELTAKGLMTPSGLDGFEKRKEHKSEIYSYENRDVKFSSDMEEMFKANKKAWDFFQSLAPSYRKTSTYWVMSAKQQSTRIKRLQITIADSEANKNRWKV